MALELDYRYEVNDEGVWRKAHCAEVRGPDNGVFIVVGEGDALFTISATRGTDAGCFRDIEE